MSDSNNSKIKVCPECQATFSCTPAGCWCSELPPVMPVDMNAECLCPTCLKEIIAQKTGATQL